jgi:LysR family transcriptional regulator, hydrogen peroxide-inducible genes activator
MTLTQLEYIVALDTHRHFSVAAQHCHVTQPTLSMQIQKLEDELGIQLFDRSRQPVVTTEIGQEIVDQARRVLAEASLVKELILDRQEGAEGFLRIGIIPTLAPYVLPLFLAEFIAEYPNIKLSIEELVTEQIVNKLKNDQLDAGLLVTPLNDPSVRERPLFYEPFVAYVSDNNPLYQQTTLRAEDMDLNDLWLLNEGHCMRSQVLNFCQERDRNNIVSQINYETGSLETLKRIVELHGGSTLLPELATLGMSSRQFDRVRYFKEPEPVREVSIVTHRAFVKKRLIELLSKHILQHVPAKMQKSLGKTIVKVKE